MSRKVSLGFCLVTRNDTSIRLYVCRKQKNLVVDPTVFTCISMLGKAMGPGIVQDIKDLLEAMMAVGLR